MSKFIFTSIAFLFLHGLGRFLSVPREPHQYLISGRSPREALHKSDFVMALCLAHKKYRLTYHTYAAPIFFVRALSHLELELIQSFPTHREQAEFR
jgi:hypothetical protein